MLVICINRPPLYLSFDHCQPVKYAKKPMSFRGFTILRLRRKSLFPLKLNEMPDKDGQFATDFVRHFLEMYLFLRPSCALTSPIS